MTEDTAGEVGIDRTRFKPGLRLVLRAASAPLEMRRHVAPRSGRREVFRHCRARLAIDIAISNVFGIESEGLWHGKRGVRDVAEARQVAMYLAHVCCRMTLTEVGLMFGRDRTTVAHACLKVEYRRDDPSFDRALDVLSWALPTLVMREVASDASQSSDAIDNQHTGDQQ
ncbi:helix-turn-helix domain-containing protein [Hyphomicrobium sp. 99]|uniref:helix-turn-helix domain-containing protein n=1 Tax=Hyphomicrobium sp. 99 TaxID=1163419 RepID=UPI001FD886F8|nr:helix-turn-helix domain-containing protein [Hyphomicrobium sp. 99]